jgi:hypothetical protein
MMKYTVEWHDKMELWDVVRWNTTVEGVYAGTTVDRRFVLEEAEEICDYYNDMEDPTLWSDINEMVDTETI